MKTGVAIAFLIIGLFAGMISWGGRQSQKETGYESLGPIVGPFVQYVGGAIATLATLAALAIYFL